MISNKQLFDSLKRNGINFFTGIPDSLLKYFCAYISDHTESRNHIITANEGNAIALATGYYLATGKIPLVYFQNSGLGNAINPLLSLVDSEVYQIPMILMIGWRGEPGILDESQHIKQGKLQNAMLDMMGIPYRILDSKTNSINLFVKEMIDLAYTKNKPVAIVVRKGTFENDKLKKTIKAYFDLSREDAIKNLIDSIPRKDIIVSTAGKTSREVFEYRKVKRQKHQNDFLTVGSMGHCSQVALGIALNKPGRRVYCLDGDGSVIMHMGSMAIIGRNAPPSFIHIVLNNGSHDSVGGQPTVGFEISFTEIAKSCGYKIAIGAKTIAEINEGLKYIWANSGPAFLEIRVNKGARNNLARPNIPLKGMKKKLMEELSK